LAKTFDQVYSGKVPNFIVWNDQFYGDPVDLKKLILIRNNSGLKT